MWNRQRQHYTALALEAELDNREPSFDLKPDPDWLASSESFRDYARGEMARLALVIAAEEEA